MYDCTRQYRCTIIRGKSQKEMDDLLPAYAKVIDEICPCDANEFEKMFNDAFMRFLPAEERVKKTLDNHRTEISGKLFGMYYFSKDGKVYEAERTQKYLEDNDQPAFFKDICYKMQFPNGTQKVTPTVIERVSDGINVRPNAFLLKLLLLAKKSRVDITKREIGYYVLNSLDVLQGRANPGEVLQAIIQDQKSGVVRTIHVPGKQNSYNWQHINEQMNYLELANLIRFTGDKDKKVVLNPNEMKTIKLFADDWNKKPMFDVYSYNLDSVDNRRKFQYDWDEYYSHVSACVAQFATSATALVVDIKKPEKTTEDKAKTLSLTEFGDEGEQIVYEYEKKRVAAFNQRLANKVLSLGKTKGLGYDIQSVIAEPGDMAEFVKYIEVKSTKRLTCPDIKEALWIDTLNITRNEWIAAQQHRDFYSIFRVYFTRDGIHIFVLKNPAQKCQAGTLQATPMTYRIEFSNAAVDEVISGIQRERT